METEAFVHIVAHVKKTYFFDFDKNSKFTELLKFLNLKMKVYNCSEQTNT